jgi:hypothetical protein
MSAPAGSEDLDDNFRELLIDRCVLELEQLSTAELFWSWTMLLAQRSESESRRTKALMKRDS